MIWSGLRFIAVTLFRWGLGAGALLSLTAEAGVGASPGYSGVTHAGPLAMFKPASPEPSPAITQTETPSSVEDRVLLTPPRPSATIRFDPAWLTSDGATPSASRAITLSSVTPGPADPKLLKVFLATTPSTFKPIRPVAVVRIEPLPSARPNFAALIDPVRSAAEQKCLAQAIYFEARSEPELGQAAVAQVVLNRIKSGLYPMTVCEVVFQNSERFLRCEFTFTCEGKPLTVTDNASWSTAVRLAREVTEGKIYITGVGAATHYHADYVKPSWSRVLEKLDVIGRHIFYSVKPGMPGGVCPGCLLTQKSDPSRTPKG